MTSRWILLAVSALVASPALAQGNCGPAPEASHNTSSQTAVRTVNTIIGNQSEYLYEVIIVDSEPNAKTKLLAYIKFDVQNSEGNESITLDRSLFERVMEHWFCMNGSWQLASHGGNGVEDYTSPLGYSSTREYTIPESFPETTAATWDFTLTFPDETLRFFGEETHTAQQSNGDGSYTYEMTHERTERTWLANEVVDKTGEIKLTRSGINPFQYTEQHVDISDLALHRAHVNQNIGNRIKQIATNRIQTYGAVPNLYILNLVYSDLQVTETYYDYYIANPSAFFVSQKDWLRVQFLDGTMRAWNIHEENFELFSIYNGQPVYTGTDAPSSRSFEYDEGNSPVFSRATSWEMNDPNFLTMPKGLEIWKNGQPVLDVAWGLSFGSWDIIGASPYWSWRSLATQLQMEEGTWYNGPATDENYLKGHW